MKRVWTGRYLLVMLGIFPLWLGLWGYRDLTAQKFAFFTSATGVWLAGLCVLTIRERSPRIRPNAGRVWVLAFLAALCLSALCSPFGAQTLIGVSRYDGLLTWLLYGCIFLGVSAYGRPRLAHAYALAGGGLVNCAVATVQLLGYNFLWLFPNGWNYYDSGVYYTGEFLGLIGNADLLSAYFCLVIPVCFGLFVLYGGRKTAYLLPAGAFCTFIMLKSGVSGGLVGLAVCALIGAPLILTDRERLIRGLVVLSLLAAAGGQSAAVRLSADGPEFILFKMSAALISAAVVSVFAGYLLAHTTIMLCKLPCVVTAVEVVCVAAALYVIYTAPPAEGTLLELSRLLHGEVADSFGSRRVEIWREVWRLIQERPWLGGGPGTLESRTALEFSRVSDNGQLLRVHVDNAHNEYLNLLVNDGLVSFVPYVGLMLATLRKAWKNRRSRVVCAMLLPLLAWWGEAVFGLGLCIVLPMMWAVWGLFWTVDDNIIM